MPHINNNEIQVSAEAMGEDSTPVLITQSEYMRRMKEAARFQPGMSFAEGMPNMLNLVLNTDHRLVKKVLSDLTESTKSELTPIDNELKGLTARKTVIEQQTKDIKPENLSEEQNNEKKACNEDIAALHAKKLEVLKAYAEKNPIISQLIDLALLQNGLLKGEALNKFLKRSLDLIK